MGSAARTVNLPLHGGKTYTPLCRHAQHFFSHSAAFTKYISKCRLFPYGLRNRARFLSRQRTAIPPWHLTVGRLFCWESPYCLRQYGLWSPYFAFAQYGLWSPYFAFAQYGLHLRLCARAGALARIRLRWPRLCARAVALARIRLRQLVYCPLGNTPSQCRLGTPRRAAIELKSLNYRHFI